MNEQIFTGIDLGSSKVAVVVGKFSNENEMLRILGYAFVPSRGIKKGQIVDINACSEVLGEALTKCERMAGLRIKSAYVTVGGTHIESLNSTGVVAVNRPTAQIDYSDIERVIEASRAIATPPSREIIGIIPREYTVDSQTGIKSPLGMSGVRLEVQTHLITAGVTNLRNIERCMDDADVKNEGFVFGALSSAHACLTDTEKELGIGLIDIGAGKTDIALFVDGSLSYSAALGVGARHFTNDLAIGLRISLESAEKIKLFLSSIEAPSTDKIDITSLKLPEEMKELSFKEVYEVILRPRIEELGDLIFTEIQKSGFLTSIPSGIVVTGGGSQTIGLLALLRSSLGMQCRLGTPVKMTGLVDEVSTPASSALVGLLYSARLEELSENNSSKKKLNYNVLPFENLSNWWNDLIKGLSK